MTKYPMDSQFQGLTQKCLALPIGKKARLARTLLKSLKIIKSKEDEKFNVYYKIAADMCGDGILTRKKDFNLVMGRRIISYKMRLDGFSFPVIARCLKKNSASIQLHVKRMNEAFELGIKKELKYWYDFIQKVEEYEKELESNVV